MTGVPIPSIGMSQKVKQVLQNSVNTQLSLGVTNQIGAGSPSSSTGTQAAPVYQSVPETPQIPVFGAQPADNPAAQLDRLNGGTGTVPAALNSKVVLGVIVAAGLGIGLLMAGGKDERR